MATPVALKAFQDLGYGNSEEHHGLPKLEYLERFAPEMLKLIVEQCKNAEYGEDELWRKWFAMYPARQIEEFPNEGYLRVFEMRYHLTPVASKINKVRGSDSMLTSETLIGAAWQFMDRTGSGWDMAKAFMIVVTLMPTNSDTSNSVEGLNKIRYVAQHLNEVIELIPEISKWTTMSLNELELLVSSRFPEQHA